MSFMDEFGKYDDSSENLEVSNKQRSDMFGSQSSDTEYVNHANLSSSQTSLSQDFSQPALEAGADFLLDFVENNGGNRDSQATLWLDHSLGLDPGSSNPGDSAWPSVVLTGDGIKRKRGNPKERDSPNIFSGTEMTTGADNWEEDSVRQKKLQNRKYSKNSRQRIKDKIKHLEEMNLNLECVAEIYRKALTVLFKRWRRDNNLEWLSRKISWHTSSYTGNEECKEVECLLPNIDDSFLEELGNASCGKIVNSADPLELVLGNQPSSSDTQNVPLFNKTNLIIGHSPEVGSAPANIDMGLIVGIHQDTFRLTPQSPVASGRVNSVQCLGESLAQTAPVPSLQTIPVTSSDPGRTRRESLGDAQVIRLPTTHQNLVEIRQVASSLVQPDRSSSTLTVPRAAYIVIDSDGGQTGFVPLTMLKTKTHIPVEQQGTHSRTFNFRTSSEKNWSLRSLGSGREPDVDDFHNLNASLDVT